MSEETRESPTKQDLTATPLKTMTNKQKIPREDMSLVSKKKRSLIKEPSGSTERREDEGNKEDGGDS